MKTRWLLLLLSAPLLMGGCATKLVREWSVRAERIIAADAGNEEQMLSRINVLASLHRTNQRGLLTAAARKCKTDAHWAGYDERLTKLIESILADRAELATFRRTGQVNRASLSKCLVGMVRASEAFGTQDEVAARLDSMESLLMQILTLEKN